MNKIQDIVAVNIKPSQTSLQDSAPSNLPKSKIAMRVKSGGMDITFYNGCDKYILYAALKEMIADDH